MWTNIFDIIENLPHIKNQEDPKEDGQVAAAVEFDVAGIPNIGQFFFFIMFLSLLGENPKIKLSISKEPAVFDSFEILQNSAVQHPKSE